MTQPKVHKKGKIAGGKIVRNWRITPDNVENLDKEYPRLGFNSAAALVNNILARYFNGEVIMRQ